MTSLPYPAEVITPGPLTKRSRWYEARLPVREHVKAQGERYYGEPFIREIRLACESAIRGDHPLVAGRSRLVIRPELGLSIHDITLPRLGKVRVVYSLRLRELVDVLPRPEP